ncbi:MAG: hypothetical protein DME22_26010 [Verrucomicrobia bacterium]|nr:MAG: hypothetical protein DME22_26010 [Verrucomicrobiota bacterium]
MLAMTLSVCRRTSVITCARARATSERMSSTVSFLLTNWTALTNVPVVVTNANVVTDTASDPRRFYRLVK